MFNHVAVVRMSLDCGKMRFNRRYKINSLNQMQDVGTDSDTRKQCQQFHRISRRRNKFFGNVIFCRTLHYPIFDPSSVSGFFLAFLAYPSRYAEVERGITQIKGKELNSRILKTNISMF
jgi:hypothetical protein